MPTCYHNDIIVKRLVLACYELIEPTYYFNKIQAFGGPLQWVVVLTGFMVNPTGALAFRRSRERETRSERGPDAWQPNRRLLSRLQHSQDSTLSEHVPG